MDVVRLSEYPDDEANRGRMFVKVELKVMCQLIEGSVVGTRLFSKCPRMRALPIFNGLPLLLVLPPYNCTAVGKESCSDSVTGTDVQIISETSHRGSDRR